MSLEQAISYLPAVRKYDRGICITGGEPLIFHSEIVSLIEAAHRAGLEQVDIVTGAGWVKGEADTRRKVGELVRAGLGVLAISWDRYHEEYLAPSRVIQLARAAMDAGVYVVIRTSIGKGEDVATYQELFAGMPVAFERADLVRLGQAEYLPLSSFAQKVELPRGPCDIVLSIVIRHDGDVFACCGPSYSSHPSSPLVLGNANREPLEAILDRSCTDPILEMLSLLGPYGLWMLLEQAGANVKCRRPQGYTSICDLCLDLTNAPDLVQVMREQLSLPEGRALLAAARLWMERRFWP
jgi:hypothetical protein